MLFIAGNDAIYCPYRDCLGIDTTSGRVSWYQLLAVSTDATREELLHRWNQRRTLVVRKRTESSEPFWDNVLDELDRALACLSNPRVKADYDENLSRRRRQTSLIRPSKPDEQDASEPGENARSTTSDRKMNHSGEISPRTRFEPLRVIGCGQQGTKVFEAYEFTLGRTVAVKCLQKPARTRSRRRSFLDEAKFLASISHPNLVEVHSVNEKNCCCVMEFLGQTVQDHFSGAGKGGCTPVQVTQFLEQGLAVLQCLHDRGVVHGAISTRSFLATETGVVKLIDAPGCTRAGLFRAPEPNQKCVAPELLSPETFGEPKVTVDLYMLGFAALELLAGEKLSKWFRKVSTGNEPDQKQWLRWHASPFEKMPSLEQLVPDMPSVLASVIEKLCQKQVKDRYQTANTALRDLLPAAATIRRSAKASGTPFSRTIGASPNVKHVGGDAPLLPEAKADSEPSPDFLTILQDPVLLWKEIRANKSLQLAAGFVLSLVLVIVMLPTEKPPETASSETPEHDPPQPAPAKDPKPAEIPIPVVAEKVDPAPLPLNVERFQDLENIPVVARRGPPQVPTKPRDPENFALQPAVAHPFDAELMHPDQLVELHGILTELKHASGSDERRRLLNKARKVAPKDPRAPFIFAATYDFGPRARNELRESVSLSGPEYHQPFRVSVEAILRGPMREARIGDQVLADLIRFRDQLTAAEFDAKNTYDWEWIGRVMGYIERMSETDKSLNTILLNNRPRMLNELPSEAVSCIDRGRRFVLQYAVEDLKASTFFPVSRAVEIDLCLATLNPEREPQPGSHSDTTIAASGLAREK
ncbi:MAG: protein kinase [Planctomycetaceae bacterium]|nr:protein kinase [Planctomycetaceae bacterium]